MYTANTKKQPETFFAVSEDGVRWGPQHVWFNRNTGDWLMALEVSSNPNWLVVLTILKNINYFTSCDPHHDIYT